MRTITLKYAGECRKCGKSLEAGETAVHERRVGVYCPGCAPTDPEEIRAVRQEAADRKADKYEEWAEKREVKAAAQLNSYPSIRHDYAFITQPGRIPFRERMNRADARAYESLDKAKRFREKAGSLRKVRVKGDAEAVRQAKREAVLEWLTVGQEVDTVIFGRGKVLKINRKTATVGSLGVSGTWKQKVELSFLRPVKGNGGA